MEELGIKILGCGMYLPPKTVTNKDFERIVDTSDEWITKRTGIKERHISQGEYTFSMGLKAAVEALNNAKVGPKDLDLIIFTTVTADFYFPSMSNVVQGRLGAENAYGIDIACACAGFVYALDMAQKYIDSDDGVRNILIISSENITKTVDYSDRSTCVLFGDGAGAVVVAKGNNKAYSYLGADGAGCELLYAHLYPNANFFAEPEQLHVNSTAFPEGKGRYMYMNGPRVYELAVSKMVYSLKKACEKAKISVDELDVIIPHQANVRIIDTVVKKLGLDKGKVYVNIKDHGNISSACIPVCLTELFKKGVLKHGFKVCLVGFGAGIIYGAIVFTL